MVSRGVLDKYLVIFQNCPRISQSASASDIWDNLNFPSIIVFHCRQIQESYPPLFQQQGKTKPSLSLSWQL